MTASIRTSPVALLGLCLVIAIRTRAAEPDGSVLPYANLGYGIGQFTIAPDTASGCETLEFSSVTFSAGTRAQVRLGRVIAALQLDLPNLNQIAEDTSMTGLAMTAAVGWAFDSLSIEAGAFWARALDRTTWRGPGLPSRVVGGILQAQSRRGRGQARAFLELARREGYVTGLEGQLGLAAGIQLKWIAPWAGFGLTLRPLTAQNRALKVNPYFAVGLALTPLGWVTDLPGRMAIPVHLVGWRK